MNDISKLLEAQKTDRERLQLSLSVERGSVKTELDKAVKTTDETKNILLTLESEAKVLQESFNRIEKVLTDTVNTINKEKKAGSEDMGQFDSLLLRCLALEGQLSDMERKIIEKSGAFKKAMMAIVQAQKVVQTGTVAFEKQKAGIADKLKELDAKFETEIKGIDEKLIAKYRSIRRQKTDGKDIVVAVTADNRCGGCIMEIPGLQISKMNTDGWIVCDECGRIIYKCKP